MRRGARACDRSDLSQSFRLPFSFRPPRPALSPSPGFWPFRLLFPLDALPRISPAFQFSSPENMSLSLVVTDHHLRGDSAAVASEPAGPLPTATLGGEAKPSSHARDAGAARRALRRWSPRAWWSMDRCHVAARAAAGCGGVYAVPVVTRVAPAGRGAGSQGPDACGCGTSDARAPTSEGEKKRAAAGTESRGVDFFLSSFYAFRVPFKFSS